MQITVRKQHIENARRRDSHHCMIADAIRDTYGALYIYVDIQLIRFTLPTSGERYFFLTPPRAQQEIIRWDQGIEIQPFTLTLGHPIQVKAVDKRKNRRAKAKAKAKLDTATKPRLVRAGGAPLKPKRPKVTRYREFGVRKLELPNGKTPKSSSR